MPGTLTFDSTKVAAHPTDDGNTLTEVDSGKVQKKEFSDEILNVLDTNWWTVATPAWLGAEGGSFSETGGIWDIATVGDGTNYKYKGAQTDNLFNNGTYIIKLANVYKGNNYALWILSLTKDADNFAYIYAWYHPSYGWRVYARIYVGGVVQYNVYNSVGNAPTKLKMVRSANNFTFDYDLGAGWVNPGWSDTQAIGADCKLGFHIGTKGSAISVDVTRWDISGTGIFRSNNPVVTYNQQTAGQPAKIQCGSASGTQSATLRYDIKFGSGGWQSDKTLAEIQAMGDQTSDTGTVDLRTVHKNGTSQCDFTDLNLPWKAAVTGPWGNLNRLQRQIA